MQRLFLTIMSAFFIFCGPVATAHAGKIKAINNSDSIVTVNFEQWFIVSGWESFTIPPKATSEKETAYSIGLINVTMYVAVGGKLEYRWPDGCRYSVPGTYLPHRTFTVTVSPDLKCTFAEP